MRLFPRSFASQLNRYRAKRAEEDVDLTVIGCIISGLRCRGGAASKSNYEEFIYHKRLMIDSWQRSIVWLSQSARRLHTSRRIGFAVANRRYFLTPSRL